MDDQQAVIDFLSKPSSYGPAIERVDIIETHVSLVFLAGECAYKLKRAVKYPASRRRDHESVSLQRRVIRNREAKESSRLEEQTFASCLPRT
jgi:aminoglycoside phosphotransferase family enzyme